MNFEYKRDLCHNYIAIEAEGEFFAYQVQMITRNKIEGLLSCVEERVDNKISFLYEISSRQPFSRVFEKNKLDYDSFCALLHCFRRAVDNAGEYLLDVNSLLLDTDYIYMNPETKDIALIYLPGLWEDIKQSFHELAKQLLNWIDYKDERLVVAAYGLFKQTSEENYTFEQILENLGQPSVSVKEQPVVEKESENLFEMNFSYDEQEAEQEEFDAEQARDKSSVWHGAGGLLKKISLFKRRQEEDEDECDETYEKKDEQMITGKKEKKVFYPTSGEEFFMSGLSDSKEYLHVAEECGYGNTTFFQAQKNEGNHRLVPLDKRRFQTFEILIYPFIIGKLEEAVDGVIADDSVSRIHAKIEKKEGQFWLSDLNSTNGVFINGKMLAPNEKTKLQPGDLMQFGLVEYRFE